ncbi:MAG: proteinase inhibitor, partial [Polyangiaceae bacterium]|nr:proteinase inhibitor [Polyangiaceae bacterium]
MNRLLALALGTAILAACSTTTNEADPGGTGGRTGSGGNPPAATSPGRCLYTNPFSQGSECKEYTGAAWTEASARADCEEKVAGAPGQFDAGQACNFEALLGKCAVPSESGEETVVHSAGSDASRCQPAKGGCQVFAKGTFEEGNVCTGGGGGYGQGGSPPGYGSTPFVQPYLSCKDPLPGEPPGKGEGGQVCTWTLISGCTEEGRRFDDYASCGDVLTQRPYYPAPPYKTTDPGDARLKDAAYLAEVDWARKQVEASACVCCHTSRLAPQGPSQWTLD